MAQAREYGRLIVAPGEVSVVLETRIKPTSVIAGFVDDSVVSSFPACVPVASDAVQAEIFEAADGTKFGIIISWVTTSPSREIEWMAF